MYKDILKYYKENFTYSKMVFSKLPLRVKIVRILVVSSLMILLFVDFIIYLVPKLQFDFFDNALRKLMYQDYKVISIQYNKKSLNVHNFLKKYSIEKVKKYIDEKYGDLTYKEAYRQIKEEYNEEKKSWLYISGFIITAILFSFEKYFSTIFDPIKFDFSSKTKVLVAFIVIVFIYKVTTFIVFKILEKFIYRHQNDLMDILESIAFKEKIDYSPNISL